MFETNKNSKLIDKRDELQSYYQENSSSLIEMKHKYEELYSDTLAKMKIDLENEIVNENLIKVNTAERIAAERASDDIQLNKLNKQWDDTENNLRMLIEQYKNKQDELRKTIDLENNERIEEQKLMIEKTRRLEDLKKGQLDMTVLLQRELENRNLDVLHQTEELEIQNVENDKGRELVEKNRTLKLDNDALQQEITRLKPAPTEQITKRISKRSKPSETESLTAKISPMTSSTKHTRRRLSSNLRTLGSRSNNDMSFLSNFSFGTEIAGVSTSSKFKLPVKKNSL
jgi:hypothetical protein